MFASFDNSPAKAEVAATPTDEQAKVSTQEVETDNSEEQSASSETAEDVTSEATSTDNAGEDGETQTEETKTKPKKGFERRIEKFNQRLSAKDQELEYWKRVALQQGSVEQPKATANPQEKPKFADFNDIEAYTDALTDWKLNQTLSQVKQQSAVERMAQTYEQRLAEFRKEVPDFDEVIQEFVDEYSQDEIPEIVTVAMESEIGPKIAYYLAQNIDEVERLKKLPSHRRLLELGKLEDRMMAKPETKRSVEEPKVSRAPQPVKSVKGAAKVETYDLRDPNLSYSEWVKRREASLRK